MCPVKPAEDPLENFPKNHLNTEAIKESLLEGGELLRQYYRESRNGSALLRRHAALIDSILRRVWHEMSMPESIALVAVGGYGRKQLFPTPTWICWCCSLQQSWHQYAR